MDKEILTVAQQYLAALGRRDVRFDSAWLFGSHAQGVATADSDIDIAVFMDEVEEKFF